MRKHTTLKEFEDTEVVFPGKLRLYKHFQMTMEENITQNYFEASNLKTYYPGEGVIVLPLGSIFWNAVIKIRNALDFPRHNFGKWTKFISSFGIPKKKIKQWATKIEIFHQSCFGVYLEGSQ